MSDPTNLILRSLADPTRRAIFEHLTRDRGTTVHSLTKRAGISQPAVSKHLRLLRKAGLVRGRREGRETRYMPRARGLTPLITWLQFYSAFWEERLDRLDNLLDKLE
jgi:DNA-binding transcriptional ArsR family regulator